MKNIEKQSQPNPDVNPVAKKPEVQDQSLETNITPTSQENIDKNEANAAAQKESDTEKLAKIRKRIVSDNKAGKESSGGNIARKIDDEFEKQDSSKIKELYTKRSNIYNIMSETVGRRRSLREFFFQGDYLKSGSRVLDAGCGSGAVTQSLVEVANKKNISNVEFYGFDLTPAMLGVFNEWIKGHNYKNIQLREANVLELNQKLPTDWSNFDLIVSANMLEHIPRDSLSQALKNLKSLLKNNGKLIVFIEGDNFINRTFIKWLWGSEVYTKDQLFHVFQEAGFKLPKIDKFGSRFFSNFAVVAESEK